MSGVLLPPPTSSPLHHHRHLQGQSPPQNSLYTFNNLEMTGRKRKAAEDLADTQMDRPSTSPSPGPSTPSKLQAARPRVSKRAKTNICGRPLTLPRLLETLSPDQLRSVLRNICDQHPDISSEITSTAPKPSVSSALGVLQSYQASLRDSFPYGDRPSSDYAYNRVRLSLTNLLEALKDYTPQFLPPLEQQPSTALEFLDGTTNIIHQLPEWDSFIHNRHKQDAYEEIAKAWALVIREAAKKGGGIQLQYNGWDQRLAKHDELSGGRLQEAVSELRSSLGWMEGAATGTGLSQPGADILSVRQQLLSNTYGANNPIHVGPW